MATSTTSPSLFGPSGPMSMSNSMPMSTVLTPVSTVSPSATPSESAGSGNNNNQQQGTPNFASGSLYLFTFLTTLLLLLTVSFGIVLRSFVLRRRFRRRVEAAIAAGVLLPGSLNAGRGDRRLQEKPKLWEVWMDEEKGGKADGADWSDIMPISAQILNSTATPPASPPPPQTRRGAHSFLSRLPLPFARRQQQPPTPLSPLSPPQPQTPSEPTQPSGPENVQVTVLIAMPSASRSSPDDRSSSSGGDLKGKGRAAGAGVDDEEDEELPEVCFGTTEVVVRDLSELGLGKKEGQGEGQGDDERR